MRVDKDTETILVFAWLFCFTASLFAVGMVVYVASLFITRFW